MYKDARLFRTCVSFVDRAAAMSQWNGVRRRSSGQAEGWARKSYMPSCHRGSHEGRTRSGKEQHARVYATGGLETRVLVTSTSTLPSAPSWHPPSAGIAGCARARGRGERGRRRCPIPERTIGARRMARRPALAEAVRTSCEASRSVRFKTMPLSPYEVARPCSLCSRQGPPPTRTRQAAGPPFRARLAAETGNRSRARPAQASRCIRRDTRRAR
jgi:hypothetical protein